MELHRCAILLGLLAISDYVVHSDARRLGSWHPPHPPYPPKKGGKWVWVPHYHESSDSTSEDWNGDGHEEKEVVVVTTTKPTEVVWEDDGHETTTTEVPPTVWEDDGYDTTTTTTTEATPTVWSGDDYEEEVEWEGDAHTEPPPPAMEEEGDDDDEPSKGWEAEAPRGPPKIVGSAKFTEEAGDPPRALPVSAVVGIAAAVAVAAAAAMVFAKKRRSSDSSVIEPEADDLILNEEDDVFVGGDAGEDIPPPPPMEANEDAIEIDESFLNRPETPVEMGEEVGENLSVHSEGLESI